MDKKTLKNYLYNLSYQIVIALTPLITAPYVAHVLHPAGVGIYSYTATIAIAFSLIAALGVNTYGQREIAYHQDNVHERSIVFWELMIARLINTAIISGIYVIFAFWYKEYTVYLLQQLFLILAVLLDITWFYQGIEYFRVIAVRNIIVKIITIFLIFILVTEETHVARMILINSVSIFSSYAIFFVNLHQHVEVPTWKELHPFRHLKGMLEFFIPLIALQLPAQIDKIMLGAITGDTNESGYYEQARRIVNILVMMITSINSVMYPRISNLYKKNEKKEIVKLYGITFKMVLILVIPMLVGLQLVSNNFVPWFFGTDYMPVAGLMKLSGILMVFMGISNFVGMQYLSPTGRQNQMTVVYMSSVALNVILNFLLIPKYQSTGAMLASITAEAVAAIAFLILLKRSEYSFSIFKGTWKYVLASFCMGLAILYIQEITSFVLVRETVIEVAIGVIVYGIVLLLVQEETVLKLFDRAKDRL